jgi:hypothetical protein
MNPPVTRSWRRAGLLAATGAATIVAACAGPLPPDWQLNAKSALDRSIAAYLAGDTRTADAEMQRARVEIARTGRPDLLARAELMQCAARIASLEFTPCERYDALAPDAAPAERAYADYLAAHVAADRVALLPPAHRTAATAASDQAATAAVQAIEQPLSRLIAAGVLLRKAQASPSVLAFAVETASAQGWRRPLLAWLEVQRLRAEKLGDREEAARLQRRIAVVERGG